MITTLLQLIWPKQNPEQFTARVLKFLQETGEKESKIKETLTIELGENHVWNLHNLYAGYLMAPWRGKAMIREFFESMSSVSVDSVMLPKDIVVVVKDMEFVRGLEGQFEGDAVVYDELNEELAAVYVVDSPRAVSFLKPSQLAELPFPREELRGVALDNLRRVLPDVTRMGDGPMFFLQAGGMFESSLLFMEKLWNKERLGISGEFVVALPTRSVLAVADSADEKAVAVCRKAATELFAQGPYSISPKLFVKNGERLDLYE